MVIVGGRCGSPLARVTEAVSGHYNEQFKVSNMSLVLGAGLSCRSHDFEIGAVDRHDC